MSYYRSDDQVVGDRAFAKRKKKRLEEKGLWSHQFAMSMNDYTPAEIGSPSEAVELDSLWAGMDGLVDPEDPLPEVAEGVPLTPVMSTQERPALFDRGAGNVGAEVNLRESRLRSGASREPTVVSSTTLPTGAVHQELSDGTSRLRINIPTAQTSTSNRYEAIAPADEPEEY